MSSINEEPDRVINNYSRRRGGAGIAGFAKATVKFLPPKDLCSGYARALGPADAFKRDNVDEVSGAGWKSLSSSEGIPVLHPQYTSDAAGFLYPTAIFDVRLPARNKLLATNETMSEELRFPSEILGALQYP